MATTKLTDMDIASRVKKGHTWVDRGWGQRDRNACKRFLDGSETAAYLIYDDDEMAEVGVIPEGQEVGNINYLMVNILTAVASIAIGVPDFHVDCGDDDVSQDVSPTQFAPSQQQELVRRFMRELWKTRGYARLTRKVLLKRRIGGQGCLRVLWHQKRGPVYEHVKCRDLSIDPTTTDWKDVQWAACRIRMAKDVAKERYPKEWPQMDTQTGGIQDEILAMEDGVPSGKNQISIWIYYDQDEEIEMFGSTILKRSKNLYGRVPLFFLEGDLAPESVFSLGDYDTAGQIQEELARYDSMINEQAENGGATGWYNPAMLNDSAKDMFNDGRPNQFVAVDGDGDEAFGYIKGEPMSETLIMARETQMKGLDAVTGVSQYQRGVVNDSVKFATEAAMLANQSGARGNAARIEFEEFLDEIARYTITVMKNFAPSMMTQGSDADMILMDAFNSVREISVIEASTAYKDPEAEKQANMQLLQVMMPFIQGGVVNPIPLITDLLRSFSKRDVARYLNQAAVAQYNSAQPQQGAPGQPQPGADPNAPQGQPGLPAAPQQGGNPMAPPQAQTQPGGPTLTHNPSLTIHQAQPEAPKPAQVIQIPSYPPISTTTNYHYHQAAPREPKKNSEANKQ